MIPKVIHFCWFGRNPLPSSALKCISSWRKYLPDYEIIEWNEDNYDVNTIPYIAEAYEAKKYAFVSDYARFDILYRLGGLYFDTDVEVIATFDEIVERGPFMGFEVNPESGNHGYVAPGLGMGAQHGMAFYKEILEHYSKQHFINDDGSYNTYTVVQHTTDMLKIHGLEPISGIQYVAGNWLYPAEYFNPFDDATGRLRKTSNTKSIHWYSKTWLDCPKWYTVVTRVLHRFVPYAWIEKLKEILKLNKWLKF